MLHALPEDAAGVIVLAFADHTRNQFVDLWAFRFDSGKDLEAVWRSIPEVPGAGAFLADRHEPGGLVDNRPVTAEWIEAVTGRDIGELIAAGRTGLEQWMAAYRVHRAAAAAAGAQAAG